ncbi:MAG: TRAP transporter small permease [Sphaerochaetaceae bacterium]|nr:TRAP transporter small permease [Sphaerochaetaceae bacterium]
MFEKRFYRFCEKTVAIIKGFTGILLCCMLLVVVFQVFWRGILGLPTPWTEEVSAYLIIYITFVGGIAVMIRGEHLSIDLVTEFCSPKLREWIQVIYNVVFIGVCSYLAFYGAQMCLHPLLQKQTSIATGIPRVYIYMIMPISMALCDLYCIIHLFFIFRNKILGRDTTIQEIKTQIIEK